jgi:ribosomal protein L32
MTSGSIRQRIVGSCLGHNSHTIGILSTLRQQQQPYPQLEYAFAGATTNGCSTAAVQQESTSILEGLSIWFAVPKSKHTRSRKRMKTTVQKRLKLKKNIVFDPRTGEVTLKHKLPFNWKDYLPKID